MMNRKQPEIRFNGYTDDWEQREFNELVEQVIREVPKPDEPYYRMSVRSHAKGTFKQFVDDPNKVAMDKLYIVKKDDLVVNITFAWEHAIAVVSEDSDGLLVSHRFPTYRADGKSDIVFLKCLVSKEEFRRKLEFISPGGAGRNRVLNKKDFLKLKVMVPNREEQQKIGNFFKGLDDTIALHQRKLELLKEQKKGFLQKMFPKAGANNPEARFVGFTDDWEERKLSDLVVRLSKTSNSDQLPKVEFEDIIAGEGRLNKDISNKFDDRKGILFEPQDILYGKLRPYLKNWLISNFKGIALGDFWVFRSTNTDPKFIYSLIQADNYQRVANDTAGTKMPRSDWKKVSSTFFSIPESIEEQQKIGSFFRQLDDTIALHQRELELLKETKKGFLQKMFV